MLRNNSKSFFLAFILFFFSHTYSLSEIVKEIKVIGNERITHQLK